MMGYFGAGHMLWGWLFGGIVLIVVVGMAIRISRGQCGWQNAPRSKEKTALEILEERYAKGEINREDYLQRKQDLENNR